MIIRKLNNCFTDDLTLSILFGGRHRNFRDWKF